MCIISTDGRVTVYDSKGGNQVDYADPYIVFYSGNVDLVPYISTANNTKRIVLVKVREGELHQPGSTSAPRRASGEATTANQFVFQVLASDLILFNELSLSWYLARRNYKEVEDPLSYSDEAGPVIAEEYLQLRFKDSGGTVRACLCTTHHGLYDRAVRNVTIWSPIAMITPNFLVKDDSFAEWPNRLIWRATYNERDTDLIGSYEYGHNLG
jgi:hypothetical protein